MAGEDRCVCCGDIIPEGKQICFYCSQDKPNRQGSRDVPMIPKRESMIIGYRYRCARCAEEVRYKTDAYCPSCGQKQNWDKER